MMSGSSFKTSRKQETLHIPFIHCWDHIISVTMQDLDSRSEPVITSLAHAIEEGLQIWLEHAIFPSFLILQPNLTDFITTEITLPDLGLQMI